MSYLTVSQASGFISFDPVDVMLYNIIYNVQIFNVFEQQGAA